MYEWWAEFIVLNYDRYWSDPDLWYEAMAVLLAERASA